MLATTRYAAADGVAAVEVEYEPLPVVVDPKKALEYLNPALAITREIVTACHGTIRVETPRAGGATFVVEIPAAH